jgi:hypothetical protein
MRILLIIVTKGVELHIWLSKISFKRTYYKICCSTCFCIHSPINRDSHKWWKEYYNTDPSGRWVRGVGLRPLACWYWGFEFCRRHEGLFLVRVVVSSRELHAPDILEQRRSTEWGVSECDRKTSIMKKPWHNGNCCFRWGANKLLYLIL